MIRNSDITFIIRPSDNDICHYGRMGMKWGKHIYGKAQNATVSARETAKKLSSSVKKAKAVAKKTSSDIKNDLAMPLGISKIKTSVALGAVALGTAKLASIGLSSLGSVISSSAASIISSYGGNSSLVANTTLDSISTTVKDTLYDLGPHPAGTAKTNLGQAMNYLPQIRL